MGSRQERNWVMPIIISIIYLNVAIDTVEWRPDPVLGFRKELDSFKQVLLSICVTAEDFSPLRVLSECCNNVCVEFVRNAWSQSGDLASFKNWPSVRSKGLDIGGITQLLARVRSVLQIFDDLVRNSLTPTDQDYLPRLNSAISNLEYQGYQMKDMEKYDASTATPAIPETRGLPMGQFLCNDIADNRSISADQLADLQAWPAMILKLCYEGTGLSEPASSKDGQHIRSKPLQTSSVNQPTASNDSDQGTVNTSAGNGSNTTIGTSHTHGEVGARRTLGVTNQPDNDAKQIKVTCLVKDNPWIWTGPPSQFMQQFECLQKYVDSQQGLLSQLELRLKCDTPFSSEQPNNSIEFLFPSSLRKVTFDVMVAFMRSRIA